MPPYVDYDAYVKDGGYKLLNDLRAGRVSKEDILKALDDSQPCAALAAPAFRRGANGARCSASLGRD